MYQVGAFPNSSLSNTTAISIPKTPCHRFPERHQTRIQLDDNLRCNLLSPSSVESYIWCSILQFLQFPPRSRLLAHDCLPNSIRVTTLVSNFIPINGTTAFFSIMSKLDGIIRSAQYALGKRYISSRSLKSRGTEGKKYSYLHQVIQAMNPMLLI
jgi:hypothetical protein